MHGETLKFKKWKKNINFLYYIKHKLLALQRSVPEPWTGKQSLFITNFVWKVNKSWEKEFVNFHMGGEHR